MDRGHVRWRPVIFLDDLLAKLLEVALETFRRDLNQEPRRSGFIDAAVVGKVAHSQVHEFVFGDPSVDLSD